MLATAVPTTAAANRPACRCSEIAAAAAAAVAGITAATAADVAAVVLAGLLSLRNNNNSRFTCTVSVITEP